MTCINVITVKDRQVNIDSEKMEIGKQYPFQYCGEAYVAVKEKAGRIVIFGVADASTPERLPSFTFERSLGDFMPLWDVPKKALYKAILEMLAEIERRDEKE